ncbi:MAG: hypothetical protein NVS3B21_24290 [Acidimicrobiales bacterium]
MEPVVSRRALSFSGFVIDVGGLRRAGMAMLGAGVVLPLLPHHPGLPCPLRTVTSIPCPFCGMTTSVETSLRGDLYGAVVANPFGLVAVLCAVILVVIPLRRNVHIPWMVITAVVSASWLWQLRRYGFV